MTGANGSNGRIAMHAATRLRQLLSEKDIIIAPGVYDGFSARIALEVGFDCLYMVSNFSGMMLERTHAKLYFLLLTDRRRHMRLQTGST